MSDLDDVVLPTDGDEGDALVPRSLDDESLDLDGEDLASDLDDDDEAGDDEGSFGE